MIQPPTTAKDAARAVVNGLPDNATWDDLQYQLYVRQQIEAGIADEEAGRLVDADDVGQRLNEHKQRLRGE